jgi:hypothetical protein
VRPNLKFIIQVRLSLIVPNSGEAQGSPCLYVPPPMNTTNQNWKQSTTTNPRKINRINRCKYFFYLLLLFSFMVNLLIKTKGETADFKTSKDFMRLQKTSTIETSVFSKDFKGLQKTSRDFKRLHRTSRIRGKQRTSRLRKTS